MHSVIKTQNAAGRVLSVVKLEPPADDYRQKIGKVWRRFSGGFGPRLNRPLDGELFCYAFDGRGFCLPRIRLNRAPSDL